MNTPKGQDYSQFYSHRYNQATQEKNYDEALDAAIKGYLIAKDMKDEECRRTFLDLLKAIVYELIEEIMLRNIEEAEQGLCCSFCDRQTGDEIKFFKGWHGTICQNCVAQFYKILTQKD